jgi:hypothetical protein
VFTGVSITEELPKTKGRRGVPTKSKGPIRAKLPKSKDNEMKGETTKSDLARE